MTLITGDDFRAFETFYDRHSTLAFTVAMRTLDDRVLAAEATQEAFLGVWRHRASYDPARSAPRTWLLSIVRHRAIDAWRSERNRRTGLHGDEHLAQEAAPDCTADQAVPDAIARDQQRTIRALLDELPFEQRQAIELAYFRGLTHVEIAQYLGLPAGTAKGRIRLALDKLRIAVIESAPQAELLAVGR